MPSNLLKNFIAAGIMSTGATTGLTFLDRPASTADLLAKATQAAVTISVDDGGMGSGFFIDTRGDVLTAFHVASKQNKSITVTGEDGKAYPATVVYQAKDIDITVLHIDAKTPHFLTLATDKPALGDRTIQYGNPFNVGLSASQGIVSALDRKVDGQTGTYTQFDAATNPGNSGGAVLNRKGQVIGMADMIFSPMTAFSEPQSSGIAFAVPAAVIRARFDSLKFD